MISGKGSINPLLKTVYNLKYNVWIDFLPMFDDQFFLADGYKVLKSG
jgi:hypothetical protein